MEFITFYTSQISITFKSFPTIHKLIIESSVPGAYQQMCMQLPERSITLKVRRIWT